MSHKILHTIICDDIRREDNGKEILIGMLNQGLVLQQVPAIIPTFAIRFLIQPIKTDYDDVVVKVIGPEGEQVFKAEMKFKFQTAKYMGSFFVKVSPMPLKSYGRYQIWLGLDEEPTNVSTFEVIRPDDVKSAETPHQRKTKKRSQKALLKR
jgi:hypothetical protein